LDGDLVACAVGITYWWCCYSHEPMAAMWKWTGAMKHGGGGGLGDYPMRWAGGFG